MTHSITNTEHFLRFQNWKKNKTTKHRKTPCKMSAISPVNLSGWWGVDACRVVRIGLVATSHFSELNSSQAPTIRFILWADIHSESQSAGLSGTVIIGASTSTKMWSEVSRGCVLMYAWPSVSWPGVWLHPERHCPRWLGPCSSLPGCDSPTVTGRGLPAKNNHMHC